MTFSWETLRLMCLVRQHELGLSSVQAAQQVGVAGVTYREFVYGRRPTLYLHNVIKFLAWLEIYDWRVLCDET